MKSMRDLKKVPLILLCFCCLFVSNSAFALDVDFSGALETNFGFALPYTENPWKIVDGSTTASGKLEVYGSNCTVNLDGSLTFNSLEAVYTDNLIDYISGGESGFSARLKEAYFDYDGSWWGFRVGRQIATWGAADSFIVSNVICPQNLTKLSGTDITDTMNGIDAVKINFSYDWFNADLYWIPFFTPTSLPLSKSNLLNSILIPQSVDLSEAGLGTVAINSFSASDIDYPEVAIENGEYAAKLSVYQSFADFSLYGFYGWDDSPIVSYKFDPTTMSISLEGSYHRLAMVALDTSIPAGPVTIRAEAAYFPQRYFATKAEDQLSNQLTQMYTTGSIDYDSVETSQQNDQFVAVAGLDWMSGDWTLTGQYYVDLVFGTEENPTDNLEREFFVHKTSVSISYSAFGGILDLSVSGIIEWNDFDSVVIPEIAYSITDDITLSLSGYFFQAGTGDGLYGQYCDLSSLMLKGIFYF